MKYIFFNFYIQDDLEKVIPDIMKLGLLHEVDGPQKATLREQPSYLSFTHKSLQEMEASKFVTQELEASKNIKVICLQISNIILF